MVEVGPADDGNIEVRVTGRFVALLEQLCCSLAISTRPNHLVLLGVDDGKPVLARCYFSRFFRPMGLACDGNRIAIATLNELFVFADVGGIARDLPDRPNYYDAAFVAR